LDNRIAAASQATVIQTAIIIVPIAVLAFLAMALCQNAVATTGLTAVIGTGIAVVFIAIITSFVARRARGEPPPMEAIATAS
tara:strand:- start:214 stop:459 length:246 start_codon:yes stop_codon:yes gene_type:complete